MKPLLFLLFALLPASAQAQSAFELMIGTWRGDGQYNDGVAQVKLRCRFDIQGDAQILNMDGRCASSLGAETFSMTFERGPGWTVLLRSGDSARSEDTAVERLEGPLAANGFSLSGAAGTDEMTLQLVLSPEDKLVFANDQIMSTGKTVTYVTLSRQAPAP